VLIIDDEPELADTLALLLSAGWGFAVRVAYEGAAGLSAAAAFRPDLILLDLAMPAMDGWETLNGLRKNPDTRGIPVVIMTAWDSRDLRERAAAAGAAKVLLKPTDEPELLAAILAAARPGPGGRV
jgi:CheY-like chemotaxis protein